MLPAMQYKTFVWPHNPKIYSISFSRRTVIHKQPFGSYCVEDLGRNCRIMEGSGEFYGADAYSTFRTLACLAYEQTPGLLIHPLWQSSSAYLTELKLLQEPGENHVLYSFRFTEAPDAETKGVGDAENYATVSEGDTLWALAARQGRSVQSLLALNPALYSANAVTPGTRVRIS